MQVLHGAGKLIDASADGRSFRGFAGAAVPVCVACRLLDLVCEAAQAAAECRYVSRYSEEFCRFAIFL